MDQTRQEQMNDLRKQGKIGMLNGERVLFLPQGVATGRANVKQSVRIHYDGPEITSVGHKIENY